MEMQILPRRLQGAIAVPPSKSVAHRVLMAQFLSGKTLSVPCLSEDIAATSRCIAALRDWPSDTGESPVLAYAHTHTRINQALPVLDCGESGSTLRFLIPTALILRGGGIFTGHGRLMERPLDPYFDIFNRQGVAYQKQDGILTLQGRLQPGEYRLSGNISSQFVTGLLFALPFLDGDSVIELTSPLESRGYVDLSLYILRKSGIVIQERDECFLIPGGQRYNLQDDSVEGDWSQAAFWYAANFSGNDIKLSGLVPDSTQADRVIEIFYQDLRRDENLEIDISGCPDLLPPLAVMAAVRRNITSFIHAGRLRLKESDRLYTVAQMLHAFGVQAEEGPDFLTVTGGNILRGGVVDGANDHRIVMAAAVLASVCPDPVTIRDAEAVRKSYPDFWEDYKNLGGEIHVL